MNPQHDAAVAAWEHHNRGRAEMPRDPIDIIGEGGSVITREDIMSLKVIAEGLREDAKTFPWSATGSVSVAAGLHVRAKTLAEILHHLEANR